MKKTILTISTLMTILTSCGPSKEQLEANEKRKLDSATVAGQQQVIDQQATADAEAADALKQASLKETVIDLKSQLAAEESKMNDIQAYKLLRTADEKDQQVSDQTRVIEELKSQITETEKEIKN